MKAIGGALLMLGLLLMPHTTFAAEGRIYSERFIRMESITVPIVQQEDIQAYYFIKLTLEARDAQSVANIDPYIPLIIDGIVTDFYGLLAVIWNRENEPTLMQLKPIIQKKILSIVPEGLIKQVFIEKFNRHYTNNKVSLMNQNVETLW